MKHIFFLLLLGTHLFAGKNDILDDPHFSTKSVGHIPLDHEISPLTYATQSFLPKVNPISGEYIEEENDFEVAGCEPLSLSRFYGHMCPSDRRYGVGWRINPEAFFIKTTTDPDGVTHAEIHDPCRRLKSFRTCNPNIIQHREFAYDLAGNRTHEIEHIYEAMTPTAQRINRWEYGPCNRLERLIESDLKETRYFYDDKGRLQTILKPDQTELHHVYDSFGRLKNLSSTDIDYTYSYDKKGRIIAVSDGTKRFYDVFDNVIEERLANG